MRKLVWAIGTLCPVLGCVSQATEQSIDRALTQASVQLRERPANEAIADLSGPIARETIVRFAVSRSPGVAALAHRARAMLHAAKAEGALPAPELGLEVWNLPLARPYALGDANMYMVELRQRFPAAGSLDARARAMSVEAQSVVAELASEERKTAQRAADAYADYLHGLRDEALQGRHLALLDQMLSVTRARYATGGSGLVDTSRLALEITKTQRALVRVQAEIAAARAMLNALLRRAPDAPLGPPNESAANTVQLELAELVTRARDLRGEVVAADRRVQSARARTEAAIAEARWPELMVGIGYWQDPRTRPGVGANVSMSLPWLWGGQRQRVDAARETEAAELSAADGVVLDAQSEIATAHARLVASERELHMLRDRALPTAHEAIDVIRGGFATGNTSLLEWLEATRSLLDIEQEDIDLTAELAHAVAALERAVGAELPLTAVESEVRP